MYALKHNTFADNQAGVVSHAWYALRGFVSRLLHDVWVPPHVGSLSVVGFFSATLLYGVVAGGHMPQMVKITTSSFGFAVENIFINGVKHMSEIDILDVLALDGDTSMFGVDVAKAQATLALLPWIETAHVRKIYPNTLQISLVEREPLALWQYQGQLNVIDKHGRVIVPYSNNIIPSLPLVVGRGGEIEASGFLREMEKFPQFKDRIRAYIRVANRRWDLLLENGIDIKLPEKDFVARLAYILGDEVQYDLLSRDVLSVDLRLEDRIILALSDDAMARRAQQIKDEEREAKRRKSEARKAGRV